MEIKYLNANEKINIEDIDEFSGYVVSLNVDGMMLKEMIEILSEEGESLAFTIARCLSFCRQCKEIEEKGGELRFKLNKKNYSMKFPKK